MGNEQGNDNVDRRFVVKFTTLSEKEEIALINEIISFLHYYYLQTGISKDPNGVEVLEYYNKYIKKSSSIQKMLDDFYVQVDAITYIEEVYSMVVLIMSSISDDRQKAIIDRAKDYDRDYFLEAMRYLLDRNNGNKDVMAIREYLDKHNIDDMNISNDYINRIINKIYMTT